MVVSGIDSGARYTHEVLEPQYRGNLGGGSFDHDFNWLSGNGSSAAPVDGHGHGTHTMGTMVGDDGGANQVGMAPEATWIACAGCPTGSCPAASLLTCAQWIAAPYPVSDPLSPDPSKRPHVVNNSWGDCRRSYDGWYQGVVDSWHAAGIYPVFSNGNAGNCGYGYPPGCNTVGNPGRYGNVTGVGSTGQFNGAYASHSNWGPTDNIDTVNPNGFPSVKPQVVAPGVNIRSSLAGSNSSYGSWDGTSMSAPHVAGLVVLMWQAAPCLVGNYSETENIIQSSAVPIPYASGCGGEGPGNVPNMATGWGEIDALEAVAQAMAVCGTLWPLFDDGFESGNADNWSNTVP
jgi:subtilisin family serine protease